MDTQWTNENAARDTRDKDDDREIGARTYRGSIRERGDRGNDGLSSRMRAYALLPSKVHPPYVSSAMIVRQRVQDKLERTLSCPVTLITGASGYGKTAAAVAWARSNALISESSPMPPEPAPEACALSSSTHALDYPGSEPDDTAVLAWYSITPQDTHVDRFWLYLSTALGLASTGLVVPLDSSLFGDSLAACQPLIDEVLIRLNAYRHPVVLVLDDLQYILSSSEIVSSLRYFVRRLPTNVHLIITSRKVPNIGLTKLRMNGLIVEVTQDDLRLHPQEVRILFASEGVRLLPYQVERLNALVHGWPAGCRMAVLLCASARDEKAVDEALEQVPESVGDYLFDEVFSELDLTDQRFMTETAITDSFCPSLAAAVTGFSADECDVRAARLLADGMFVERVSREGDETWYRYQSVFLDMLRSQAPQPGPERLYVCRIAARDWFDAHGYEEQAIEMSALVGDERYVTERIRRRWKSLYMSDSSHVLLRWASCLPQEHIEESPFLCIVLAMPYALKGDFDRAQTLLARASTRLKNKKDFLYGLCAAQRAYIAAFRGDVAGARTDAQVALDVLPTSESYLRAMMSQIEASSYLSNDPIRTCELYRSSLSAYDRMDNANLTCSAYANLALAYAMIGDLENAQKSARDAFELYAPDERPHKPMLSVAIAAIARASYEHGDFDAAMARCDEYLRTTKNGYVSSTTAQVKTVLAKLEEQKDHKGQSHDRQMQSEWHDQLVDALALSVEGTIEAFPTPRIVRAMPHELSEVASSFKEYPTGKLLWLMSQYYQGNDVAAVTRQACEFADEVDPRWCELAIRAQLFATACLEYDAKTHAADKYIATAIAMARSTEDVAPLVEYASELETVFGRLLATTRDLGLANWLKGVLSAGSSDSENQAELTDRELECVRLMASGKTLAQAADELFVSRETVKKHLANAYVKLGVHSRTQAVAVLRERGLI